MQAKPFAILIAIVIFLFVIESIRSQKMTFKYSLFWLVACGGVFLFAIYDGLLSTISEMAGFTLPSNFVFFLLLVFFIGLSLMLTIYINEQNSRTENLAQAIAALQYKIKKLQSSKKDS